MGPVEALIKGSNNKLKLLNDSIGSRCTIVWQSNIPSPAAAHNFVHPLAPLYNTETLPTCESLMGTLSPNCVNMCALHCALKFADILNNHGLQDKLAILERDEIRKLTSNFVTSLCL